MLVLPYFFCLQPYSKVQSVGEGSTRKRVGAGRRSARLALGTACGTARLLPDNPNQAPNREQNARSEPWGKSEKSRRAFCSNRATRVRVQIESGMDLNKSSRLANRCEAR